jgi:hypothetical protein
MKNKYARADPDYTPNNYDIIIKPEDVNPELPLPNVIELKKEINEHTPLSKNVHILLEAETDYYTPLLRFRTSLYTGRGERLI